MAADVASSLASWSTTESSNSPSGSTSISTNLDDNLRMIQAVVRALASSDTIASATTTDIGSKTAATFLTVSGTTTITGLGTVSAGIWKILIFADALTFTHNGTSLILPTAANITTAAGDIAIMLSLGSGNWRCLGYQRASGASVGLTYPSLTVSGALAVDTTTLVVDATNNRVGIGTASPAEPLSLVLNSGTAGAVAKFSNGTDGTGSFAGLQFSNAAGLLQTNGITSASFTPNAAADASQAYFYTTGSGGIRIGTSSNYPIIFSAGNKSVEAMRVTGTTGNVLIGTDSDVASSILTLASTTKGFLPPRMTEAQRDAIGTPATGLVVYNTNTNKLNVYTGAAWEAITSA